MSRLKKALTGLIAGSVALTALATGIISQFEGRELRAYQDIVNVWTICDGETKGVKPGQVATPRECDAMLAKNLMVYEQGPRPVPDIPRSRKGQSRVPIVDLQRRHRRGLRLDAGEESQPWRSRRRLRRTPQVGPGRRAQGAGLTNRRVYAGSGAVDPSCITKR